MHWTLSTSQPILPPTSSQEHACTTASSKGNILETAAKISRGLEQDNIPDKPVKFSQQLIAFTLYGKQREIGISLIIHDQYHALTRNRFITDNT